MLSRGPRTTREGRSGAVRWAAIVAVVAEVALVVSVGAFAHPGSPTLTAALAVGSPSVDGSIKPANEWADAGSLSIPFPGHPATLSVKHKNDVLYVLLSVQDDRPPAIQCCSATIYFDANHNGVREPGADAIGFGPGNQGSDLFFMPPGYQDDRLAGGTADTVAGGSYDAAAGRLILEARKPLCSGDTHDFCIKVGATLGFTVEYVSTAGTTFDYPATPPDFAHFSDLVLSPAQAAELSVKTDADAQSVGAGGDVTFAMTVTNNGPGDASDTVLNAAFKPSAGIKAILPPGTCGCGLGTLHPGESVTIKKTITLTSIPLGGGTISVNATAASAEGDPDPTNNAASTTVKATAAPAAGEAVTAQPAAGVVSVRAPGTGTFVSLGKGQAIPNGSEVDASKGQVVVTSATPSGTLQKVTAAAGRFLITQPKSSALTSLRLSAPLPRCGGGRGTKVLRRLRVAANGKFRTVGRRGYATGRSPKASWVIVDRCVPVRRSLAIGAKPPKRKLQTCILAPGSTNPSRHTQADLHDPAGHKLKGNCYPAP